MFGLKNRRFHLGSLKFWSFVAEFVCESAENCVFVGRYLKNWGLVWEVLVDLRKIGFFFSI